MGTLATTKLSSKGQVVIPEEIRSRLGLEPGAQFVVLGQGDVVVLKTLDAPSMDQFDEIVARARKAAKDSGMKPEDITQAIAEVRASK
jgi:AbrB family looped-hinge helix DNA binding protein